MKNENIMTESVMCSRVDCFWDKPYVASPNTRGGLHQS